ncbi:ATP-grasp domain-containing protein [Bacillus sp. DNRA2]|uniref:ATP-grasp domain-containing protein n=1 Tax=Bacillus sp. DNRA2 TaxID=2723053 RepID=UPI00145C44FB|nr:ATP-grasp domain-containing protein [Bacillus sp. DNRA2]NMD70852.1 ATP-grasp domain-containing protein [Bacillus sp. DNRA2]
MNILICSAGRRVKLIEYFKNELQAVSGKVIAVDCDPTAPALYHADLFEIVPRIDAPDYIPRLKELCKKHQVTGILSLIDPELSLLASVKEELALEGIRVIVSQQAVVDLCFDKYMTAQFLQEHNLPAVPTFIDFSEVMDALNVGELQFPLIVKPRFGSASIGLHKVTTLKELMVFQNDGGEWIVQPFIDGEEIGCDCYIDLLSEKTTNIFMKKKIRMRAGETDKSIAMKDSSLKRVIERLIAVLKPHGPIDIDCFKIGAGYHISEINPRFGGGYLHAHEMGQNFVKNIIRNLNGEFNEPNSCDYQEGSTLIKFDHFILL